MRKKLTCLLLALAMLLPALLSCGGGSAGTDTGTEAGTDGPATPEVTYRTMTVEDYTDRTTAGFLAQLVGFLSGYEFARKSNGDPQLAMPDSWFEMCNGPYAEPNKYNKHTDKLLYNDTEKLWEVWSDDDYSIDILNQYILRDMYEQYGTVTQKVISEDWVKYNVYDMGGGHRTTGAYGLFKTMKYLPDFAGSAEYGNTYTINGEPYIENETLGMVAAGMPDTAAWLSEVFANVTSDQDPVLWAKFFATLYSLAYFETDIPAMIRKAAEILPEGGPHRTVIDQVFALKEKYGTDWRRAVTAADKECYNKHYGADSKMGETSINCSFILIGLLFGNGDFTETCKIISLAGHGGDSTTPVGLGIVAVMNGTKDLPAVVNEKVWQDGKGVIINNHQDEKSGYWMYSAELPERLLIKDIVDMFRENFESLLIETGGKIEDGVYYIPEQTLGRLDGVMCETFESGKTDGWTTEGNVSLGEGYMGEYGLKLAGNADGSRSSAYTSLSGLRTGERYRVTLYGLTATRTEAEIFVRNAGETDGVCARIYNAQVFYRRTFDFTATAETMEIGVRLPKDTATHKYALIDEVTVYRIEETEVAQAAFASPVSDGKVSGKVTVNVSGKATGEVLLRLTFQNTGAKCVGANVTVNGVDFRTAPFYVTGPNVTVQSVDVIFIPILLTEEENTVTLDFGQSEILLHSVAAVMVKTLF